jgi:hypothetical protein
MGENMSGFEQLTFDQELSERLKQEGMSKAADHGKTNLEIGRHVAKDYCRKHGTVNADNVGGILNKYYGIKTLGGAAGSLFRGGAFEWTGECIKSIRITNHRRELRVWRLRETRI